MTTGAGVPRLNAEELLIAVRAVEQLRLGPQAELEVLRMLIEASTPDRHDLARQPGERGANMRATQRAIRSVHDRALDRMLRDLMAIPDEEWDRLLEQED